ncbi:hypothetical protein, partial [Streptomyces sp. H27-C3]|uniref:hypothetical protein n=1 Tax=Streptomyces sp. H27-C3 TaxID=3046305 RepID=UPI0024B9F195
MVLLVHVDLPGPAGGAWAEAGRTPASHANPAISAREGCAGTVSGLDRYLGARYGVLMVYECQGG